LISAGSNSVIRQMKTIWIIHIYIYI
jgi:hypothetical protein